MAVILFFDVADWGTFNKNAEISLNVANLQMTLL